MTLTTLIIVGVVLLAAGILAWFHFFVSEMEDD